MRRFVTFGPAFVVILAAVATLAVVPSAVQRIGTMQTRIVLASAQRTLDDDDILERLNRAVRAVAETVEPSVVHIEVMGRRREASFSASSASGWVYNAQGHIVTNAHVVRNAEVLRVQFSDGRTASADLIGADPFTDIAVVKVDPDVGVFPARRATNDRLRQGERVFAFGSPFGFKFSMSEGIVSGLGRTAKSAAEFGGFTNFIQTDAAVNPGNSGGPLVDIKGRVVGMNVAIATARDNQGTISDGQSAGISFAIPLGTIESVVDQLIQSGKVSRGLLGIAFNNVPVEIGSRLPGAAVGIRVNTVSEGGPAERAGFKAGDVIVAADGQPVAESDVLRSVIAGSRPGSTLPFRVWRAGEVLDLQAVLGEMPREMLSRAAAGDAAPYLSRQLGLFISMRSRPPTVARVVSDSPADEAGVVAGQTIVRVGDTDVTEPAQFYEALVDSGILVGDVVKVTLRDPDAVDGARDQTVSLRLER